MTDHASPDHHPTKGVRMPRVTSAWDVVRCVLVALAILVVFEGDAVSGAAEELPAGIRRDTLEVVGGPTGWVADHLPFAAVADQATGWFSPGDENPGSSGETVAVARGSGPSRVPPQAFDPVALGGVKAPMALKTLLVTGDSMSQPLDAALARDLAEDGVRTIREPRLGTGISKPFIVDWGELAVEQTNENKPDAVVIFLGANEGFPLKGPGGEVECCGADWAAEYATRARGMMDTYRRNGATRVYWALLPAQRDPDRAKIARTVNAAIRVAAGAFGAQVTVVDSNAIFSPDGKFRAAISVAGRDRVVRDPDGIHLNEEGAALLADVVTRDLRAGFGAATG